MSSNSKLIRSLKDCWEFLFLGEAWACDWPPGIGALPARGKESSEKYPGHLSSEPFTELVLRHSVAMGPGLLTLLVNEWCLGLELAQSCPASEEVEQNCATR